jgi:hypothetical protein
LKNSKQVGPEQGDQIDKIFRKARQLDPALSKKRTAKHSESEDSEDDEPSDTDSETKQMEQETTQLPLLEPSNFQSPISEGNCPDLQPGHVWAIHDTSGEKVICQLRQQDTEESKFFRCHKGVKCTHKPTWRGLTHRKPKSCPCHKYAEHNVLDERECP